MSRTRYATETSAKTLTHTHVFLALSVVTTIASAGVIASLLAIGTTSSEKTVESLGVQSAHAHANSRYDIEDWDDVRDFNGYYGNSHYISGSTATTTKVGLGILHSITINAPMNGTIVVYDYDGEPLEEGETRQVIARIFGVTQPTTLFYDAFFIRGLHFRTSGDTDFTVSYR